MARFSHTVEIPRPPEEVFPWLLEEDKVPRWTGNLESYKALDGTLGTGSRVRQVLEVSGRRIDVELEITEYDPPRGAETRFSTNGIEVVNAYALEASGAGTRLTQSVDAKPSGLTARMLVPVDPAAAGGEAHAGPGAPADRAVLVRSLLVSVAILLFGAPAAMAQDVAETAGEALRDDPVYVDPGAEAQLSASEQDDLRAQIRDADEPIFIAVLPDSAGQPEEVGPKVADAAGEDGTYGVVVGRTLVGGPGDKGGDAAGDAAAANDGEGAAAVLTDFVDRVVASDADDGGGGRRRLGRADPGRPRGRRRRRAPDLAPPQASARGRGARRGQGQRPR